MEIIWKSKTNQSPYLFRRRAELTGVTVHHARVMPGRTLEHATDFHEVNVTLGGLLMMERMSANGKLTKYTSATGNVCVTPAGQSKSAIWDENLDHLGILLDPQFTARTAIENCFNPTFEFVEIYKNEDSLIQQIGLTLVAEADAETPAGKLYTDSLIQTLTLHLLKNYSTANSVRDNSHGGLSGYKLRRVKDFINANLEEDLSLAEIAAVANLSQYHFARSFRKTTGYTPQQFLMQRRIERAKELLAKDDLPIVEISLRTGFKNQSHFTTLFRKYTKFTPKLWRELKLA